MVEPALLADQVIFTSIPSYMGEGYRIVAASSGIRQNERAEITQRCPSHNSLSNPSPDATGFLSFRLTTGRFCVGYSCYAGAEHTARGGQRVYTRLAVLDRETFHQFNFNPLPIHAILASVVGPMPSLKTPDRLDPLLLSSQTTQSAITQFSCTAETIGTFIKFVLESHQMIAAGHINPQNILNWILALVPFSIRENLSASIGLNYVPARKFQLTFLDRDDGQTKRLIRGRNIDWLEPGMPSANQPSAFDPWIAFIEKSWNAGQHGRLRKLAPLLDLEQLPQDLNRLADLYNQLDNLDSADGTPSHEIPSIAAVKPSNPAEAFILNQLQNCFVENK